MEALSNTVETRLKASSHNRPPFNPELPVSKLNEHAEVLAAAEKERETVLYAELARQEKLAQLVKQFNNEATEMNNWASAKLEYLNTQTNIETLPQVLTLSIKILSPPCPLFAISSNQHVIPVIGGD